MMRLVVLLCAIISLVHGTCTPWNGSPITSGTIFQLYHPFTNLWITNRAVPPYNNVQGLALSVAQSTAFYYNSVSGFSYSGAVGVQGVMSSYEGHSFTCSYGGNEFSTCPSGQSPAWKLAIVANGAAPTVRLWTSQMTGSFGWQLGVKQDYQNTLWMNLNRVEDFHLYICDSILQYQTIYPGHSLVLGPIFSFTQSAIIKFTTNGGTGRIFDKITAGTSDGWLLDVLGGKYRAILGNNVFTYTFPNAYAMPAVPLNQYQFVTFAYNHISGWGHLFVNGQWYNSLWSPNMAPNNLPWRVGIASDGSNSFPGTIERARFYWTLLGDGDVLADFNRAASETGYTFAPVTL